MVSVMTALQPLLDNFDAAQRDAALQALDAISRPMTVREIERALRNGGVPRSRAVKLASTLKHFHIITLIGPETPHG
jgi:hypothetical protein